MHLSLEGTSYPNTINIFCVVLLQIHVPYFSFLWLVFRCIWNSFCDYCNSVYPLWKIQLRRATSAKVTPLPRGHPHPVIDPPGTIRCGSLTPELTLNVKTLASDLHLGLVEAIETKLQLHFSLCPLLRPSHPPQILIQRANPQ